MKIKKLVDRTLVLYLIIGVLNFIVCTALMFFLFNLCDYTLSCFSNERCKMCN